MWALTEARTPLAASCLPLQFRGLRGATVEAVAALTQTFIIPPLRALPESFRKSPERYSNSKEQEKLHEEIIDKGLAKIYQDHLDRASDLAKKRE